MSDYFPPAPPETEIGIPVAPMIPHSREAEEAAVGAVLINPEAYYEVAEVVKAEDFYIHRLRWCFEAFRNLHEKRIPIDQLTVADDLGARGMLAEIGGPAYLTSLVNQVPTSLNAMAYAQIVKGHSDRRKMIEAANAIAKAAYDTSQEISASKADAETAWNATRGLSMGSTMLSAAEMMSQAYDRYAAVVQYGRPPGIITNLLDLDRILHGVKKGWFYLFAGLPGYGKSALLLTLMRNFCKFENQNCAFFSIEMQESSRDGDTIAGGEISSRLIAMEAGLDASAIMDGRLSQDEYEKFVGTVEKTAKWTFHVDDDATVTPDQMYARCLRLKGRYGLDVVFVDYLQLQRSGGRYENRTQEVSYLSRSLKQMGKELNVVMIAAAQVNRAYASRGDKKLGMSDLKESGSLEADANGIIFIQPSEDMSSATRVIDVVKHRGGKIGDCSLYFDAPSTEFRNGTRRNEEAVYWWQKNGNGNGNGKH